MPGGRARYSANRHIEPTKGSLSVVSMVRPSWLATLESSRAARALPEPEVLGSRFYLWFYRFSQNLLANLDLSAAAKKQ